MSRNDRAEWLAGLRPAILSWIGDSGPDQGCSQAYTDLTLAYGLAWLGAGADKCRPLVEEARRRLEPSWDDAHAFLLGAYQYRIGQALEGAPGWGPLPGELLASRDHLGLWLAYVIDRLRITSEILEPLGGVNPYRNWSRPGWERSQDVGLLPDIADPAELSDRIRELLLACAVRPPADQADLLRVALKLSPRVGGELARDLLARVGSLLGESLEPWREAALLEAGLSATTDLGLSTPARELLTALLTMLNSPQGACLAENDSLVAQSIRAARRLSLWREMALVTDSFEGFILQGQGVPELRRSLQELALRDRNAPNPLAPVQRLLQVAGGWLDLGQRERGLRVLDEAWDLLTAGQLRPGRLLGLAPAYVRVLGRLPAAEGRHRSEEVFACLQAGIDRFTTSTHYALTSLQVVESLVLAFTTENIESLPPAMAAQALVGGSPWVCLQ